MAKHIRNEADGEGAERAAHRAEDDRSNDLGLTRAFAPLGQDDEVFLEASHVGEEDLADDGDDFESPSPRGAHAHRGAHRAPAAPEPEAEAEEAEAEVIRAGAGKHGAVSASPSSSRAGEEIPSYLRKSRRMRRVLTAVIVLLVALLLVGAYFAVQLFTTAQTAASQQTQLQQTTQDTSSLTSDDTKDASTATAKKTSAPSLVALLGLTQDEAVETLARGAQVTSSTEVNEEGNPIKTDVRIALTDEPADARTGTPTVYLGLDEDGAVVQAGYSASTASLGYGSLSFSDAVRNESIVEKTLQEAGVQVPLGSVELPADKTEYSTYASDGTTLVKEYCPFSGSVDIEGAWHEWSAVLSYDYSVANASGNLADTIRIIYVYVNA